MTVDVLRLSPADRRLLAARFAEHDNSQRRMLAALAEAGAAEQRGRLEALRRVEHHFAVDLGSLCHRYDRRDAPGTHPLERTVLDYVAEPRPGEHGEELWVLLDRLRQVRDLVEEGDLVREPEA